MTFHTFITVVAKFELRAKANMRVHAEVNRPRARAAYSQ